MHLLLIPINYPNTYDQQGHVFFEAQAHALALAGINVGVLAILPISFKRIWRLRRADFGFEEDINNGITVVRYKFPAIPKMRRFTSWLQTWIGKRQFYSYIKKYGQPDIAHVHVSLAGELAVWMNHNFHIPYVVTEHYTSFLKNNMPSWQKNLAHEVFTHSKKNIAVSNEFASRLRHDYKTEFKYIPNIVDTDFFIPRLQTPTTNSIKNFLNIGNLKPQKSQDMLIRAFARSFKGQYHFRLNIVGSGPELSRLKKITSALGMENQISFFGQADRMDVLKLMQESDFFALSSTYETFGVVVIEAMSCGLPVIATRSGGPESIITEENLGILCDIDEVQFAEALIKATNTSYDSNYIRNYAVTNFSSSVIADQLINVYSQALNNTSGTGQQTSAL